jgi:uncharacterized protein YbgA (DUF1722 family)
VEKLQEAVEDYRHKCIIAENLKKELEGTVKIRSEELKKSIELLEREKISCVELKHNLVEKDRLYQRVTNELERSNGTLSQNYEETNSRLHRIENHLKMKTQELEALQRNYDSLGKKLAETERFMKTSKEISEQASCKKSQTIDELESKLRSLKHSSKETIESLEAQLAEFQNQKKTEGILIDKNIECNNNLKQQRLKELEVIRLEEANKQLVMDFEAESKLVLSLKQRLKTSRSQEEYEEVERKVGELQRKIGEVSQVYEDKLMRIGREMELIKVEQVKSPVVELAGKV